MNGKVDAVWAMAAAVTGEEAGDPPLHPGPGPGLARQHALTPHSSLLLMLSMCYAALIRFLSYILHLAVAQGLVLPLQYTTPPISSESWRTMILQQK